MHVIVPIESPGLGNRSYLAHDGRVALAVDPPRDHERVQAAARAAGVRIAAVAETHLHNDWVSGARGLAAATGAPHLLSVDEPVEHERQSIAPGQAIPLGTMCVHVVAAPGHTPHHVAFVLEADGRAVVAFTGGSLMHGTVGRPDLVAGESPRRLAREQWATARRLRDAVPADALVLPTHGHGSFCGVGQAQEGLATMAGEVARNDVFRLGEEAFVDAVLAALDDVPAYYAHMAAINAAPQPPGGSVPAPEVDAAAVRATLDGGGWVIDVRRRDEFARAHARGTVNLGADGKLATFGGWLLPWGERPILAGADRAELARAELELARVGYSAAGVLAGAPGSVLGADGRPAHFPRRRFADLPAVRHRVVVLDVRLRGQHAAAHVKGAVNIPLHELPARTGELAGAETWVHCGNGYRSSIAASILAARRRCVVLVDDEFANARGAGLEVVADDPVPEVARAR
jgi:glyoxylase-like metal-dependent hydrolase (beta-lactamase superfamily II)/rhodanese-related sulfurtransferase